MKQFYSNSLQHQVIGNTEAPFCSLQQFLGQGNFVFPEVVLDATLFMTSHKYPII